jgi:predicted Zn-dependent protease with MMP-like domain
MTDASPWQASIADFDDAVAEALGEVPEHLRAYLDTVQVVTAPVPDAGQRRRMGVRGTGGLYGLYEGWPVPDRLVGDSTGMTPSVIAVFRIPLRRDYPDPAELRRQIRRTVFHELAHHFGIDDDALRAWGAY